MRVESQEYGKALVELTRIMSEMASSSITTVLPPSAVPTCGVEILKWGIVRQLFIAAVEILGSDVVSTYVLGLEPLDSNRNAAAITNTAIGADEHGNPTMAGALIHQLVHTCPADIAEREDVQQAFSSQLRTFTCVLAGGSASKRVMGDLTNILASFHNDIPVFRSELWRTLGERSLVFFPH